MFLCLPLPCSLAGLFSLAPSLLLLFSGDGTVPIMLKLGLLTVSNHVTYNPKIYDVLASTSIGPKVYANYPRRNEMV
jgi:hypothetical protein